MDCAIRCTLLRGVYSLLGLNILEGQAVVLVNVNGLPRIVDPDIANSAGGEVSGLEHVAGESTLLRLVLVLMIRLATTTLW